jgi:hypothetical protein
MVDVLALNNGGAWNGTNILTVPLLWTVEVVTSELRERQSSIQIVPSFIVPYAEHRIPCSWDICRIPSISEINSGIINVILATLFDDQMLSLVEAEVGSLPDWVT